MRSDLVISFAEFHFKHLSGLSPTDSLSSKGTVFFDKIAHKNLCINASFRYTR